MKTFLILFVILMTASLLPAQGTVGDAPKEFKKLYRQPQPLRTVREADVLWVQRIIRRIDMRNPVNKALRLPLDSEQLGKRSLFQVIYSDIIADSSFPVKMYLDANLTKEISREKVLRLIFRCDSSLTLDDHNNIIKKEICPSFNQIKSDVVKIDILEEYFYNRATMKTESRILSMGFHIPQYKPDTLFNTEHRAFVFNRFVKQEEDTVIWFFYPDLRYLLANSPCYMKKGTSQIFSYDEVFIKKMFSAYILKNLDVYSRNINQYSSDIDALIEEEKAEYQLLMKDVDLWEY